MLDVCPGWGGGKLNATSILLESLSEEESLRLVDNLDTGALGEPTRGGDEGFPHGHGRHHEIGRAPAQSLRDLVGDGLLALVLVRIARGAAVEEEPFLREPVPQRDEVVVHALVDDEVRGGGGHVEHLGHRGPLVAEDE